MGRLGKGDAAEARVRPLSRLNFTSMNAAFLSIQPRATPLLPVVFQHSEDHPSVAQEEVHHNQPAPVGEDRVGKVGQPLLEEEVADLPLLLREGYQGVHLDIHLEDAFIVIVGLWAI